MPRGARVGVKTIFASRPLAELLRRERRALDERREFLQRQLAIHGRHAAVGARVEMLRRHVFRRRGDHARHFLRRLDRIVGHVDDTDEHVLALQQLEERDRHLRMYAFERDLVELALRERREDFLVLAPFVA